MSIAPSPKTPRFQWHSNLMCNSSLSKQHAIQKVRFYWDKCFSKYDIFLQKCNFCIHGLPKKNGDRRLKNIIASISCDPKTESCPENRSQGKLSQENVLASCRDLSPLAAMDRGGPRAWRGDWREKLQRHRFGGKKLTHESFVRRQLCWFPAFNGTFSYCSYWY